MNLLKLIKVTTPLFLSLAPLVPFLNGAGCHFTFTSDNSVFYQQGTCRNGVISVYITNKSDGKKILKKMRWGYFMDRVYTYPVKTTLIHNGVTEKSNADLLYKESGLISGAITKLNSEGSVYVTLFDYPIEIIYLSKIKGSMGFY